jgi:predicted extracellular nuclease|tara:strand:+ start:428 stop:613 length:186 start_codon:yes stop_codon:yes gene_type:complete
MRVATKTLTAGDKVRVHDSVSKYCGMSGIVEKVICHGIYSVKFSSNISASLMLYQISKNGR